MKTKKYVMALVFALLCAVIFMPKDVMAATSGSCGTGSTWSYSNGVLTISGTGVINDNPWIYPNNYQNSITKVVINEGITSIDTWSAFQGCTNLTQVLLPDSLTYIDTGAFAECIALQSITIPKNVTDIGGACFYGSGLKTVTIANGATIIPAHMFKECKQLQTVNMPNTITEIGTGAFMDCVSLPQISLPGFLTVLGTQTFKGCKALKSITIPKTLKSACASFEDTGVTTATFADGTTTVAASLFKDCTTLQTIHFPQSITTIEFSAFEGCTGLTKVTLPWYLKKIELYAFAGCTNLKEITIYQKTTDINSLAFNNVTGLKIYGKAKSTPQTFAKKNGYAFATCKIPALKGITYRKGNLKYTVVTDYINGKGTVCVTGLVKSKASVTIPKAVKLESYSYKVVKINTKAFYKKSRVKKVTIKSTTITSVGKNAFKGINKKATFKVPKSKYSQYKKLLTSKTGFAKKTMKIKK